MNIALLSLWPLAVVALRGPHHPKDTHVHYRPKQDGPKLTQDTDLLHDKAHIQEDLGNTLSEDDIKNMSPEEMEFHYFKLHDFDNNTKLDGLEILQSIRHTIEHEENRQAQEQSRTGIAIDPEDQVTTTPNDYHYFIDLIDQVLLEDDSDRDGYLSYSEYVVGRQRVVHKRKQPNPQARY